MHITFSVPVKWLMDCLGVDVSILADNESSRLTKDLLIEVLSRPLPDLDTLGEIDAGTQASQRMTLSLPSRETSVLRSLGDQRGLTPGPMAKQLLGWAAHGLLGAIPSGGTALVAPDHPMARLNSMLGEDLRVDQARFYDILWTSLGGNGVGLCEGGTGIGKTRATISAATRWAKDSSLSICITAPSIAILRQYVSEYRRQALVQAMPELRLIVGRGEYVSEEALSEFLAERGSAWAHPEVLQWQLNGGDLDEVADTRWQAESLAAVCPDFPLAEVRLNSVTPGTMDRGWQAYRAQFAKDDPDSKTPNPPSIFLCSHAMLAQDLQNRLRQSGSDEDFKALRDLYRAALKQLKGASKANAADEDKFEKAMLLEIELGAQFAELTGQSGILPPYHSLIVDEAHLLEQSISNSLSEYLSLRALLQRMRDFKAEGGSITTSEIDQAQEAIQRISDLPTPNSEMVVVGTTHIAELSRLADLCEAIPNVRDKASRKFSLSLEIKRAGYILRNACGRSRTNSYMRFSPVRAYPQLITGRESVSDLLSRLWGSLRSAACVSATLYLEAKDSTSCAYMRSILSIPDWRAQEFAPVHAPWSRAPIVQVLLPNENDHDLLPPRVSAAAKRGEGRNADAQNRADYAANETRWHDAVAIALEIEAQRAVGNTLVLCTSYHTVHQLAQRLETAKAIKGTIIEATQGVSLQSQARQFLVAAKAARDNDQGERVLWLAIGNAWTGLDVGGHEPWKALFGEALPAEVDNVLTDLVIPRLPFRTNQSLTHMYRIKHKPNFPWDVLDAALRFKQGIGRLVRRQSLPKNRRIIILDARLVVPNQRDRHSLFTAVLARLPHGVVGG